LPEGFKFTSLGVSDVIQIDKTNFAVIKTLEILEPAPMQFKEAKGRVMNDYQQYVEQEWVKQLKATYPVKVNQKTVKKLVKQNQ
jgi:peptidyl-prolyl cis-trans isomerase SurA